MSEAGSSHSDDCSPPTSQPSALPSGQPSGKPSGQPSSKPSGHPSGQPSSEPSGQPSAKPSVLPSGQPSGQPSGHPSGQPSGQPSSHPHANLQRAVLINSIQEYKRYVIDLSHKRISKNIWTGCLEKHLMLREVRRASDLSGSSFKEARPFHFPHVLSQHTFKVLCACNRLHSPFCSSTIHQECI